jgi:hypothetical protein
VVEQAILVVPRRDVPGLRLSRDQPVEDDKRADREQRRSRPVPASPDAPAAREPLAAEPDPGGREPVDGEQHGELAAHADGEEHSREGEQDVPRSAQDEAAHDQVEGERRAEIRERLLE